jgi:hypothetical protein
LAAPAAGRVLLIGSHESLSPPAPGARFRWPGMADRARPSPHRCGRARPQCIAQRAPQRQRLPPVKATGDHDPLPLQVGEASVPPLGVQRTVQAACWSTPACPCTLNPMHPLLSYRPSIEAAGYHSPPRYRTNHRASSSEGPSAITLSTDLARLAHSYVTLPGFRRARAASARSQPFCRSSSKAPIHFFSRLRAEGDPVIEGCSAQLRRKPRSS